MAPYSGLTTFGVVVGLVSVLGIVGACCTSKIKDRCTPSHALCSPPADGGGDMNSCATQRLSVFGGRVSERIEEAAPGVVGRRRELLLLYYVVVLMAAAGCTWLAVMCVIFASQADVYVDQYWQYIRTAFPPDVDESEAVEIIDGNLTSAAVLGIVTAVLLVLALYGAAHLLGHRYLTRNVRNGHY
jgi:hypothetical protein